MHAPIKTFFFFAFLAALPARGDAPVITGTDLAVCGQGATYQLAGSIPSGGFHWHLERAEGTGPAVPWDGNAGRRSLTLSFSEGPGSYRLWVQADGGESSNRLDITALASEPLFATPEVSLETELPAARVLSALELAAAAQRGPREARIPAPASAPPGPGDPSALRPDAQGLIDLAAAEPAPDDDPIPNPFRAQPAAAQIREIRLQVSAVFAAPDPGQGCGVVNGRLVSVGDQVEGLVVAGVTAEAVELRAGDRAVELPLQDQPVRLRLPR